MSHDDRNPEANNPAVKAKPDRATSKSCCGGHDHHAHADPGHHSHHAPAKVLDPVCGMTVDPATSKHRFDHDGHTFHFCSAGCRTKFAADPKKYLEKTAKADFFNVF